MKKIFFWSVILIFCVFLACLCTNYDYDLFARLIVGEKIVEEHIFLYNDFLSYTPTHPWYDHEWGSSVVFYGVLKLFGPIGLIFLYALMLFGVVFFIVKTQKLQKHSYPTSIIFTVLIMAIFVRIHHSLVRCHLFTFFFFAFFLYVLEKERRKGTRLIWLLPPLVIIWNNLHGGVVAGLGLMFMYVIGEFLNKKPIKNYFISFLTTIPLLIINPYGLKYLNFLFSATTMNRRYITEWRPFFHPAHVMYYISASSFIIFGFVVSVVNIIRTRKIDYTKIIVLVITVSQALWHLKLLTLGVIVIAALCSNEIISLFVKFKKYLKPIEKSIYGVILLSSLSIPLFSPLVPRADFALLPLYEVEFLKLNNIKGNIVVPFGLGSYVSYKLYPDNLIYMDGRYEEVYNNEEFINLREFELVGDNWKNIVNNYNTDILMPRKDVLAYYTLQNDKDWVLIFDGRKCGIFVKKENVKPSYIEPDYGIDYYRRTMFSSTTFGKKLKRK